MAVSLEQSSATGEWSVVRTGEDVDLEWLAEVVLQAPTPSPVSETLVTITADVDALPDVITVLEREGYVFRYVSRYLD